MTPRKACMDEHANGRTQASTLAAGGLPTSGEVKALLEAVILGTLDGSLSPQEGNCLTKAIDRKRRAAERGGDAETDALCSAIIAGVLNGSLSTNEANRKLRTV